MARRCGAAAGHPSPAAHLAGVSGSVAAVPRKAAVPSGLAAAAEGCPEARASLAAEQKAPKLMDAIDRSFRWPLGPGNTGVRRFAPLDPRPLLFPNLSRRRNRIAVPSPVLPIPAGGSADFRARCIGRSGCKSLLTACAPRSVGQIPSFTAVSFFGPDWVRCRRFRWASVGVWLGFVRTQRREERSA